MGNPTWICDIDGRASMDAHRHGTSRNVRFSVCRLHTSAYLQAVDKALLSKLRKKTGISFINCKKALEKFDNDFDKAQSWLKDQAEKEGWTKASKLENRPMSQGLIGLIVENNHGAMLEVNCETDFVARNTKFQQLVSKATNGFLQYGKNSGQRKLQADAEILQTVQTSDGKTLQELIVVNIGQIGENMLLRRAVYMEAANSMNLGSYIHSAGAAIAQDGTCRFGKYGAFVIFSQAEPTEGQISSTLLGQQLGQHIVGMNPKTLGTIEESDSESDSENKNNSSDRNSESEDSCSSDEESATALLHQSFLLDEGLTVRDILKMNSAVVEDFVRIECGEVLEKNEQK